MCTVVVCMSMRHVHLSVGAYVCEWTSTCVYVCLWRPGVDIRNLPRLPSTLYTKAGSLSELSAHGLDWFC